MSKYFKKLGQLEFSVYGKRLLDSLVSKPFFNFLVDRELLPEFFKEIERSAEFKNFAHCKLKFTPSAARELLSELRVLPNDKAIIRMFKQWRSNIDNREQLKLAEAKVRQVFKSVLVER